MSDTARRESRWQATPYFEDAVCDVCLSTKRVKIGTIKTVLEDGRPWPGDVHLWALCDDCHRLGSGLVHDVSVNGTLVYLAVRVADGNITRCFVFAPFVSYDRLF